jgi:protein-S-isoprenylcysteine O-methyltransferase Ste14
LQIRWAGLYSSGVPELRAEDRGADVRFPPPVVFLIALLTGVLLRYAWMPLRFPAARFVSMAVGLVLIGSAIAIAASARTLMVRTGQSPIPWKPTPDLILQGPYRFTRNPMYVGLTLLTIGLGFALDNVWISVLALPSLGVVHYIAVVPEERYLSKKFGEPYRRYLTRVRRYI